MDMNPCCGTKACALNLTSFESHEAMLRHSKCTVHAMPAVAAREGVGARKHTGERARGAEAKGKGKGKANRSHCRSG